MEFRGPDSLPTPVRKDILSKAGRVGLRTVQIATADADPEPVLVGIRSFPVHKLILLTLDEDRVKVEEFATGIKTVLGVSVETYPISNPVLEGVLEIFAKVSQEERGADLVVNVAGGNKLLGCAALSAAFINGLKAFGIEGGRPMMLPFIKLSYSELISEAKLDILRAIERVGGVVDSLRQLSEISGYGKPLLSYHIRGADNSEGLERLGLVQVERVKRGKTIIKLTALGKMLIVGVGVRKKTA